MTSGDMFEGDITLERAKQRDARTDEDRNTGDNEPVYEAGLQKPLDREPAIDVDMLDAAHLELRHDVGRSSGHLLHYCPRRSRSNRTTAEHEDRLLSVDPLVKAEGRLEGLSADHQCIHRGHEFLVAMRFNLGWEKIEGAVGSSDEAVEAGANKDGCFHCRVLKLPPNGRRLSCGRNARWHKAVERQKKGWPARQRNSAPLLAPGSFKRLVGRRRLTRLVG